MTPRQKVLAARLLRPVPASLLVRAAHEPRLGRLARAGLRDRDVVVGRGAARGLHMNPGPSNPDYALGTNEPIVQDTLAGLLRPGSVFYDVGANVGFLTLVGARAVGTEGYVYAFEADLDNAARVRANVRANQLDRVLVVSRAVGRATGVGRLQLAAYAGGHALGGASGAAPPPDLVDSVPVEVVTLDDFSARPGILAPDVVKIDVEGGELDVLAGMGGLLAGARPVLLLELDDATPQAHDLRLTAVEAVLRDHGYTMERLPDAYPDVPWVVSHWVCRAQS